MPDRTLRLPSRPPTTPSGGKAHKGTRRRSRRGLLAGLTVIGLLGVAGVGAWAWWNGSVGPLPIREHCTATVAPTATSAIRVAELDPEQAGNAAIIAAVARKRGLPARAASIGIATAIQESKLRNINYGDRDSLGLFQQRPSQGWGTRKQITNPVYASNAFYDVLAKVDGYETMPITEVAQKVQRSAFPDAYADHEPEARIIASALSGYSPAGFTCVLRSSQAVAQNVAAGGLTARAKALNSAAGKEAGREDVETVGTGGTTLRFTVPSSPDDRDAWALAHWAVARAAGLEVIRVDVANRRWDRDHSTDGWTTLKTPLANGAIVVTVA
jgi:hypothetical protein